MDLVQVSPETPLFQATLNGNSSRLGLVPLRQHLPPEWHGWISWSENTCEFQHVVFDHTSFVRTLVRLWRFRCRKVELLERRHTCRKFGPQRSLLIHARSLPDTDYTNSWAHSSDHNFPRHFPVISGCFCVCTADDYLKSLRTQDYLLGGSESDNLSIMLRPLHFILCLYVSKSRY